MRKIIHKIDIQIGRKLGSNLNMTKKSKLVLCLQCDMAATRSMQLWAVYAGIVLRSREIDPCFCAVTLFKYGDLRRKILGNEFITTRAISGLDQLIYTQRLSAIYAHLVYK